MIHVDKLSSDLRLRVIALATIHTFDTFDNCRTVIRSLSLLYLHYVFIPRLFGVYLRLPRGPFSDLDGKQKPGTRSSIAFLVG